MEVVVRTPEAVVVTDSALVPPVRSVTGWKLFVQQDPMSDLKALARRWNKMGHTAKEPYQNGTFVPRRLGYSSDDDAEEDAVAAEAKTTR